MADTDTTKKAMMGAGTGHPAPGATNLIFRVEHAVLHVEAATEGVDPLTKEPVIRYPGTFTMEGVMNGTYKPASEVENPLFWRFFDGLPYVEDHPKGEAVLVTGASQVAGFIDKPKLARKGERPIVKGRVNIYKERDTGKRALHRIVDLGMTELSIGFWTSPQRVKGTYHDPALDADLEYDFIETDLKPDHVATVDMGACSGEMGCGLGADAKLNVLLMDTERPMGSSPLTGNGGSSSTGSNSGSLSLPPGAGSLLAWDPEQKVFKISSPPFLPEEQGAVASHNPPKAPMETPWSFSAVDGDAIISRGGFAAYKQAHAWVEGMGTPEKKASYKLPHHKVVSGSTRTVWRGVVAAAVVIQGGRGGLKVPAGDVAGIKAHIAAHYKQFDKEAPFDREGDWLYPEETEAEVSLALDREIVASHGLLARIKAAIKGEHDDNTGGDPDTTHGGGTVCEEHEALEQERDDLLAELAEAKAELTTLKECKEKQEREALLTRLEAATGLEGEKLVEALHEVGLAPKGEALPVEALKLAIGSAELAAPRTTKTVGSVGAASEEIGADHYTAGVRGVHYDIKDGKVVAVQED